MPKTRATEFFEDDLLDYLHDWDYSFDSDDKGDHIRIQYQALSKNKDKNNTKTKNPQQQQSKRQIQKARAKRRWTSARHINLPLEVIERICSFCSQSSLRIGISLVSKLWHKASLRYLRLLGIWDPSSDSSILLGRIQSKVVSTLRIDFLREDKETEHRAAWAPFAKALTSPRRDIENDETLKAPIHHLKGIHYRSVKLLQDDPIFNLLPYFGSLQRLHLEYMDNMVVSLFSLLDNCASLQELSLFAKSQTNCIHVANTPSTRGPYSCLQHLVMMRPNVEQTVLERTIDSCPNLQVLKIMHANPASYNPYLLGPFQKHDLDIDSLYARAGQKCPRLVWIHIMRAHRTDGPTRLNLVPESLPWIRRMSLAWPQYQFLQRAWTPDQQARAMFSRLTHIELCSFMREPVDPRSLDKILRCTPNLVHLFAGQVIFCVREVREGWDPSDDWHRWPPTPPKLTKKERKKENKVKSQQLKLIAKGVLDDYVMAQDWQCLHLRTLIIGVAARDYHCKAADEELFLYLARYCPNIVDLTLRSKSIQFGPQLPLREESSPYISDRPKYHAAPKKSPYRAPSSLPLLAGLKKLQSLTLMVDYLIGPITAEGFEFLRRTDLPIASWIEEQYHKQPRLSADGTKRPTTPVLWPQLESFTILSSRSPMKAIYEDLMLELEIIRPGVAFRIAQQEHPFSLEHQYWS
ncbi:hypothetical protein BGZ83_000036 [Gryganskiella cystojenkinii]|nr:hypothetical protein BGZ83_000036 [Gryganskiella cystojenkinii]